MADKKAKAEAAGAAAKSRTSTNAEQKDTAAGPTATKRTSDRGWNTGSLFWGLLLVAFGGLLLLGNLGVIEVRWGELWRLWPLLIVAAGFSVLATAHWIWKVASVVFIAAAIAAVVWVGAGMYEPDTEETNNQNVAVGTEQGVAKADVSVQAGASKMTVKSDDISEVVRADLNSNGLRLEEKSTQEGDTQKVVLSSKAHRDMWFGAYQNTWDVTLTERLPMKLTLDAGASSIDADLSGVQLTDLSVKAGASSSVLTLGDKQADVRVDIDSGVSSMTLRMPKESGVTMNFDGGLSAREFADLKEVSKGVYRSDNYETANRRISITADAGLASFKIERF